MLRSDRIFKYVWVPMFLWNKMIKFDTIMQTWQCVVASSSFPRSQQKSLSYKFCYFGCNFFLSPISTGMQVHMRARARVCVCVGEKWGEVALFFQLPLEELRCLVCHDVEVTHVWPRDKVRVASDVWSWTAIIQWIQLAHVIWFDCTPLNCYHSTDTVSTRYLILLQSFWTVICNCNCKWVHVTHVTLFYWTLKPLNCN